MIAATSSPRRFILKCCAIALIVLLLCATSALAGEPRLLPAPNAQGLWGYVDAKSGAVVVTPRYARAGMFHGGAAIVHMSFPQAAYSKWDENGQVHLIVPRGDGLIDEEGKDILSPLDSQFISLASPYAELEWAEPSILPGLYLVQNFSGQGVFDLTAGWLLEAGPHEDIRFMPDGSFIFNSSSYVSAAPERNIYFAPSGHKIMEVELATRAFILESASQAGAFGVSRWSGEMLNNSSYRSLMPYAGCSRWAGMTLGGRLDVFDMSGKILQSYTPDFRPQMSEGGTLTLERGAESFVFDPCSLELIALDEYAAPHKDVQPEPDIDVVFWGGRAMLIDSEGNNLIAPLYEMLLPAGYGYWWGRVTDDAGADGWVLIDSRDGREIRMPE